MRQSILLLPVISLFLLFTGCEAPLPFPCEAGEGNRVTEARSPRAFTKIILDLPGDVYVHKDTGFFLNITAQQNIIDQITTDVNGNVLEISSDNCFRSHKTIEIEVGLPDLAMLEVMGSGDFYGVDNFNSQTLELSVRGSGSIELEADAIEAFLDIQGSGDIHLITQVQDIETHVLGSGDVYLTGSANFHNVDLEASGNLNAFDFNTHQTDVRIAGSGNGEVSADSLLNVKIRGSGNVLYKGTPALNVDITGTGEVISAN